MLPAPTLPSYPLYLLLHPAHAARLRARNLDEYWPPPAPQPQRDDDDGASTER